MYVVSHKDRQVSEVFEVRYSIDEDDSSKVEEIDTRMEDLYFASGFRLTNREAVFVSGVKYTLSIIVRRINMLTN